MAWEGITAAVDQPLREKPGTPDRRLLSQEDALPLFKGHFKEFEKQLKDPRRREEGASGSDAKAQFGQMIGHLRDQVGDRLRVTHTQKEELTRWIINRTNGIAATCSVQDREGIFRSLAEEFDPAQMALALGRYEAVTTASVDDVVGFLEQSLASTKVA